MPRPIVTFTSDFGTQDWFVGVVHGVLAALAPSTTIVDLNHAIPPGDVARGAFLLEVASGDFPAGTTHLAVVDPGVGTDRRALAVRARGSFFVGPDNGLLEWALCDPAAEVHELTEERWFRTPVSRTFHGRDVFAPVAARLSLGTPLSEFGPLLADPLRLARIHPRQEGDVLHGQIVFIDRFGNALTNVTEAALREAFGGVPDSGLTLTVPGRVVAGLARTYGDAPVGTIVAVLGSSGRLELAQVGGHAAERLGLGLGDPVSVRLSP